MRKPFAPQLATERRGFTKWTRPVMRGYKMACCDCGLVHEFDFHVIEVTQTLRSGAWRGRLLPMTRYRVQMRARRAERYTAWQRKGK